MKMFTPKTSPKYGLSNCKKLRWPLLADACYNWRRFLYELDVKYEDFDLVCLLTVLVILVGVLVLKGVLKRGSKVS